MTKFEATDQGTTGTVHIPPFALIIEDEPNQAKILATVLQMLDFETEIIYEGQTALNRITQTVPQLIILDLHLPSISGSDILRKIQADHRLYDTRIIVVTGDIPGGYQLHDKVDLVLAKPIVIQQFHDLMKTLLG